MVKQQQVRIVSLPPVLSLFTLFAGVPNNTKFYVYPSPGSTTVVLRIDPQPTGVIVSRYGVPATRITTLTDFTVSTRAHIIVTKSPPRVAITEPTLLIATYVAPSTQILDLTTNQILEYRGAVYLFMPLYAVVNIPAITRPMGRRLPISWYSDAGGIVTIETYSSTIWRFILEATTNANIFTTSIYTRLEIFENANAPIIDAFLRVSFDGSRTIIFGVSQGTS